MHWFAVDETNKNSESGQFFIVGGLVVTHEQLREIHGEIEQIRLKHGYRPGDQLKFQSKARPDHVPIDVALAAKQAVIEKLENAGVRMIVYVILHDIAKVKSEQVRMQMGLNTVAVAYNKLLLKENSDGCMMIDRDDQQHSHLSTLFQHGVTTNGSSFKLNRIKFYGMTSDNSSHLSSAVDVALGGFRYCVNAASRQTTASGRATVKSIFQPLSRLLWGVADGGVRRIGGYGYIPRPSDVRKPVYKDLYASLTSHLEQYSNSSAQEDHEQNVT